MCAKCGVWDVYILPRNRIWIHAFHWSGKAQEQEEKLLASGAAGDLYPWVLGKDRRGPQ